MKLCTIVVPCYNEEEVIPVFYQEVCLVMKKIRDLEFQILFIDDGSQDAALRCQEKANGLFGDYYGIPWRELLLFQQFHWQ